MPSPSKRFRNGQRDADPGEMGYRSLSLRSDSLDIEGRSVEAVVSTEQPVDMPDWQRMEIVPEVLLTSGARIPKSRQVPFLDSHQRASVKDQLGSARNLTIQGEYITGRLTFSETANDEFTKVREKHVTDVSVGYTVLKRTFVPKGETKSIGGRSFTGPVNVVTEWRLREVSLTPIGADDQAKLRGLDPAQLQFRSSDERVFAMNEALRKLLESKGMPSSLTDDEAQRWLLENPGKLADAPKEEKRAEAPATPFSAADIGRMLEESVKKHLDQQASARAAFVKEVDQLCDLAGLPDSKDVARGMADVDAVRKFLIEEKAKRSESLDIGPSVRITGDGYERMVNDLGAVFTERAMTAAGAKPDFIKANLPGEYKDTTRQQWKYATAFDMARELVQAQGVNVRQYSREDIAIAAMFGTRHLGVRGGGAYHTTGVMANVTLDAMKKSVNAGYSEAPSTWEGPMRRGESTSDFKNIHRVSLSAVPNIPVWNDNKDPEQVALADYRSSYGVESRSAEISFSYKLLVNDDMGVFSRIAPQMGNAARRTVNAFAWSQITANPTMDYDSVALFSAASGNRKRPNLVTGAGSPSVSTLQTLSNLMRQMRGENQKDGAGTEIEGADILNLSPRYLVVPSALDTTAKQLVLSAFDPSSANQAYNTASTLLPVVEPLLDANSTTAWYLFADPSQIDTVEITFLQGQETPAVRQFVDDRTLSLSYIILQTFGAKAMNHRGIIKHAGA